MEQYIVTIQVNSKAEAKELRDRLYLSDILKDVEKSNLGFQKGIQE